MNRKEVWEGCIQALEAYFTEGEFEDGEFKVEHNSAVGSITIISGRTCFELTDTTYAHYDDQHRIVFPTHYMITGQKIDYSYRKEEVTADPDDGVCQAVKDRMEVTRGIIRACHASDDAEAVLQADGSEKALIIWASILKGIVNEYLDGGDQMVENCTCGQHTQGWSHPEDADHYMRRKLEEDEN